MTTTATSESKQQPAATTQPQPGAGVLAAGASFFLPGLGHFLAKSPARGAIFLVLWWAALSLSYKALDKFSLIGAFPFFLGATILLMFIASIDAFFVGRKKGLIAGGCVMTYSTVTFILSIGFALWAIVDAMSPRVGPSRSFSEALLRSFNGKYAIGVAIVGLALLILAALGRRNVSLSGVVRVGLGILIAGLLFWPHDKMVQKTAFDMLDARQIVIINEDSMSPTIVAGDWIVVHKDAPLARFDPALLDVPAEEKEEGKKRFLSKIKRIYGMPGEEIDIVAGSLMVNRDEMPLPPKLPKLTWSQHPLHLYSVGEVGHGITLKNDEYYVLGDNLDGAYDSRYAKPIPDSGYRQPGAIPKANIGGRATFCIWPPSHFGSVQ
jgi:signal peptidase I